MTASLLKPFIHIFLEVFGVLAKFFTIHFAKAMTVTGLLIAIVCALAFVGTKK